MKDAGRVTWARFWHRKVEEETESAEGMFLPAPNHLTRDKPTRTFFVSVIVEEVGKLARAANKLSIIPANDKEREQWNIDGEKRLLTIASLVRRMAELWPVLPDEHTVARVEDGRGC